MHGLRNPLLATVALACLAACGGGGGGGSGGLVAALPPPPASSASASAPAPPQPTVEIFQAPATQEFAALTAGAPTDSLRIRYDAGTRLYEVMAPGRGWDTLVESPRYQPAPGYPNQYFAFALSSGDGSFFQTSASYRHPDPEFQYEYSNIAVWGEGVGAYWDKASYTAFGMATQPGGVPITGTATYEGFIAGTSSVEEQDFLIGDTVAATIEGTVSLRFDFGSGSLAGEMHPIIHTFGGRTGLGTFAFTDTIFGVGQQTFSGRLDTGTGGNNSFSGLFTGPSAEELMASWAFDFVYPIDGSSHAAMGAWIAKRD